MEDRLTAQINFRIHLDNLLDKVDEFGMKIVRLQLNYDEFTNEQKKSLPDAIILGKEITALVQVYQSAIERALNIYNMLCYKILHQNFLDDDEFKEIYLSEIKVISEFAQFQAKVKNDPFAYKSLTEIIEKYKS